MKVTNKATLALLTTVILWSFHVVISRAMVIGLPVFTVHFFRMLTAFIAFLPFFIAFRPWEKKQFFNLVFTSLFATANMTLFIIGVQFTSASASQLIYAAMPIAVILIDRFFKKANHSHLTILGVIIGFIGILVVVSGSKIEEGITMSGGLTGNLIIILAMSGWLTYIIRSKKLSQFFTPFEMGSASILVSFLISIPLWINEVVFSGFAKISPIQYAGLSFMGVFGTFATYILYQYAIKHSSSLKVTLTSYLQPITTAILAMIFLSEEFSLYFFIGSILVLFGVFLTTSYKLLLNKKKLKSS